MSESMLKYIGLGLAILAVLFLVCTMFFGQQWGFPLCFLCIILSNAVSIYRHKKYDM